MRISTPVTSRARKENTVSQCVTRTRRECRGLIVSAIRESVPMAHALCTGYPRNSRRNVPQCLVVLPVTWFPVFDFTGNGLNPDLRLTQACPTCTLHFVMPNSRKIVFGFALLGLAVAGVCYAFAAFHDYSKPWTGLDSALTLLSVIVCPPQLIFPFCMDCEVIGW